MPREQYIFCRTGERDTAVLQLLNCLNYYIAIHARYIFALLYKYFLILVEDGFLKGYPTLARQA